MATVTKSTLSRFQSWLKEYTEQNNMTASALAVKSELSPSTLLRLMREPGRSPDTMTCIKLARSTGQDLNMLLELAGQKEVEDETILNPLRYRLLKTFDQMPYEMQQSLLTLSESMLKTRKV